MVHMFLNGDGMAGGRLHHQLLGAPLVTRTESAAKYRFYAVDGHIPAMDPVGADGRPISGEVYDVPLEVLRDNLLPSEPDELELGIVELADGRSSLAMLLRRDLRGSDRLTDVTRFGSWAEYRRAGS